MKRILRGSGALITSAQSLTMQGTGRIVGVALNGDTVLTTDPNADTAILLQSAAGNYFVPVNIDLPEGTTLYNTGAGSCWVIFG